MAQCIGLLTMLLVGCIWVLSIVTCGADSVPLFSEEKVEKCAACGYEYDPLKGCGGSKDTSLQCGKEGVPFDELPDDWTCPVCGASKDQFHAEVAHASRPAPAAAPETAPSAFAPQPAPAPVVVSASWIATGNTVVAGGLGLCFVLAMAIVFVVLRSTARDKSVWLVSLAVPIVAGLVVVGGWQSFVAMPPLFKAHVVGMLACWCFMTLGTVLYAVARNDDDGNSIPRAKAARVPHAVVQSIACVIGVVGVACIFENHAVAGVGQFGLEPGTPLANTAHACFGWVIVTLMVLQGTQGWMKYLGLQNGKLRYMFHPNMSRGIIIASSANIMIILWSFRAKIGVAMFLGMCAGVVFCSSAVILIANPTTKARETTILEPMLDEADDRS